MCFLITVLAVIGAVVVTAWVALAVWVLVCVARDQPRRRTERSEFDAVVSAGWGAR